MKYSKKQDKHDTAVSSCYIPDDRTLHKTFSHQNLTTLKHLKNEGMCVLICSMMIKCMKFSMEGMSIHLPSC
jgi:hypothetical protein